MPSATENEVIYSGHPWMYRSFGLLLAGLFVLTTVNFAVTGSLNAPVTATWPFYVIVGGIFAPVAIWMLTRPSVRLLVDRKARELAIERTGLLGRTTIRVPLSGIARIGTTTVTSADGDAHFVDLTDSSGKRIRVSAGQVWSVTKAERIAQQIESGIARI